jgi:hypothetical protein
VAFTTGIFPDHWVSIVTGILTDIRQKRGMGGAPLVINGAVVSSFSVGILYSDVFRKRTSNLQLPSSISVLKQVWDLDGFSSTFSNLSRDLTTTPDIRAIKYDQGAEPGSFHVPASRWANYPDPPPNPGLNPDQNPTKTQIFGDVHHAIRDHMFLHAATIV